MKLQSGINDKSFVDFCKLLSLFRIRFQHSYYKEMVMKPGKVQRNKQRSTDLCWKVHDPTKIFFVHTLAELRNRHVSIG